MFDTSRIHLCKFAVDGRILLQFLRITHNWSVYFHHYVLSYNSLLGGKNPNNHKKQLILKNNKKDRNCYRKIWQTAKKLISAPSSPCVHIHVSYFNLPRLWRDLNYVKNWAILPNYLLSWTLRGGLMRLSSVRGPYSDCGDENPGIKQENIHNCSLLQLFWSACSHKRKRRTPSRRILKEKKHAVSYLVPEQTKAFPFVREGEGERER